MTESEFELKWGKTHTIQKIYGSLEVNLPDLPDNQSVCYGDGKTFYYLLIKKE